MSDDGKRYTIALIRGDAMIEYGHRTIDEAWAHIGVYRAQHPDAAPVSIVIELNTGVRIEVTAEPILATVP